MLDWNQAEQLIERAFVQVADQFQAEQLAQLEAEKWAWPRETKRKSGQTVGSPRDIIDTGELKNSLSLYYLTPTSVEYQYASDHAMLVHQGATLSTGTVIPARPWVDAAADELRQKWVSISLLS